MAAQSARGRSDGAGPTAAPGKRRQLNDGSAASISESQHKEQRQKPKHASGTRCVRAGDGDVEARPMYDSTGLLTSKKVRAWARGCFCR